MWEKRYGAVEPDRSNSNRRLYRAEDVERLVLMKRLTDRGHAISTIANLGLLDLEERLEKAESLLRVKAGAAAPASRLLVVGSGMEDLMRDKMLLETEVVANFEDFKTALADKRLPETDLLVISTETLFPETITAVREVVTRSRAARTILIYRFTSSKTATALAKAIDGLCLLKAPIGTAQLRRECLVQLNTLHPRNRPAPAGGLGEIPERLYDANQLARLTQVASAVECECPQHMAGLLQSLSAFETYSQECEDRNPEDAVLHAFLHRTTAHARRIMEEALRHLIRVEGIRIE
jgi:DNA-binding transcriptional MerR regulator